MLNSSQLRDKMISVLRDMPEEAFGWFVLAAYPSAMLKGANTQIWPDGIGGFTEPSRKSITEMRETAAEWVKAKQREAN